MRRFGECCLGYVVAGVFVFGVYEIARDVLKADDTTIMLFAIFLIWSDLATFINKDDKKTNTP